MRLKILTTTFVITSIVLLLGWPLIVGPRPAYSAPKKVKVIWGRRALVYFGCLSGALLCTATSSLLIIRRTRLDFLEQERKNLQELVEGTLRDHGRKP